LEIKLLRYACAIVHACLSGDVTWALKEKKKKTCP